MFPACRYVVSYVFSVAVSIRPSRFMVEPSSEKICLKICLCVVCVCVLWCLLSAELVVIVCVFSTSVYIIVLNESISICARVCLCVIAERDGCGQSALNFAVAT